MQRKEGQWYPLEKDAIFFYRIMARVLPRMLFEAHVSSTIIIIGLRLTSLTKQLNQHLYVAVYMSSIVMIMQHTSHSPIC